MLKAPALLFLLLIGAFSANAQEGSPPDSVWYKYLWYDPAKIVTGIADADRCAACHKLEYQKWETTKHATNFKTLHETQRAKDISKRLGFPFMQYESLCIKCHYTGVVRDGELQAVFGVSCQSCHGPAWDWIEIHNKWGEGHTHDTETSEHRKERISHAKAAGMLRPSELYGVVANCYQCHTVPHEELVNKGEHPVGSSGFDLLQRIDEIRHNYLRAQFDASDTSNHPDPPGRSRVMFVVGRMVDVEYSIRAVAEATAEGTYSKAMVDRASNAAINLQLVNSTFPIPEVTGALKAVNGTSLKPNNQRALLNVADGIRQLTKQFIQKYTTDRNEIDEGGKLSKLDNLIAGKEEPVTESVPSPPAERTGRVAESTPSSPSAPERSGPAYEVSAHIRPFLSQTVGHRTVGPSNCSSCHKEQNEWAKNDRHITSLEKLVGNPKAYQIAGKYYGRAFNSSSIVVGSVVCMDCHATVISGQTAFPARYGATCESCHGPSGDYKEKHSNDNPPHGYSVGKDYGMLVLEQPDLWAEDCAQCHYVTDPRLIAAGHPGDTFKEKNLTIIEASKKIFHWPKGPAEVPSSLSNLFEKVKNKRGAIPAVTQLAAVAPSSNESGQVSSQGGQGSVPLSASTIASRNINIGPFPILTDSSSVEERLLLLKKRLEELYRAVGATR